MKEIIVEIEFMQSRPAYTFFYPVNENLSLAELLVIHLVKICSRFHNTYVPVNYVFKNTVLQYKNLPTSLKELKITHDSTITSFSKPVNSSSEYELSSTVLLNYAAETGNNRLLQALLAATKSNTINQSWIFRFVTPRPILPDTHPLHRFPVNALMRAVYYNHLESVITLLDHSLYDEDRDWPNIKLAATGLFWEDGSPYFERIEDKPIKQLPPLGLAALSPQDSSPIVFTFLAQGTRTYDNYEQPYVYLDSHPNVLQLFKLTRTTPVNHINDPLKGRGKFNYRMTPAKGSDIDYLVSQGIFNLDILPIVLWKEIIDYLLFGYLQKQQNPDILHAWCQACLQPVMDMKKSYNPLGTLDYLKQLLADLSGLITSSFVHGLLFEKFSEVICQHVARYSARSGELLTESKFGKQLYDILTQLVPDQNCLAQAGEIGKKRYLANDPIGKEFGNKEEESARLLAELMDQKEEKNLYYFFNRQYRKNQKSTDITDEKLTAKMTNKLTTALLSLQTDANFLTIAIKELKQASHPRMILAWCKTQGHNICTTANIASLPQAQPAIRLIKQCHSALLSLTYPKEVKAGSACLVM
jgi:hypothetical protein